jgi:hypothetical protein
MRSRRGWWWWVEDGARGHGRVRLPCCQGGHAIPGVEKVSEGSIVLVEGVVVVVVVVVEGPDVPVVNLEVLVHVSDDLASTIDARARLDARGSP